MEDCLSYGMWKVAFESEGRSGRNWAVCKLSRIIPLKMKRCMAFFDHINKVVPRRNSPLEAIAFRGYFIVTIYPKETAAAVSAGRRRNLKKGEKT